MSLLTRRYESKLFITCICLRSIKSRTFNEVPFKSPLLGLLLRGYFIEGKPRQDRLLISFLKRKRQLPLTLIAMVTSLVSVILSVLCWGVSIALNFYKIGHALQEYSSGYKVENAFSVGNLSEQYVVSSFDIICHAHSVFSYKAILKTLHKLDKQAPAYVEHLKSFLFSTMM